MKTLEQQLQEASVALKAVETENATLKAQIKEAEVKVAKVAAQGEIVKAIEAAKLPKVAAERLTKQFAEATSVEGLKEAIVAEADYVKAIAPNSVKHNGASDNVTLTESGADPKEVHKKTVESYRAMGLSEAEAEVAAKL